VRERAPQLAPGLAGRFPAQAFTIHRLFGASCDGTRFGHHAGNPLALDVLVVDEASMLDLALATRLFEAVPAAATVVLLGDKDQLAAVEAGSVFADLASSPVMSDGMRAAIASATGVEASPSPSPDAAGGAPLQDCVVWLTENFRFGAGSAIGTLAACINLGDAQRTLEWLRTNRDAAVTWLEDGNRLPAAATVSLAAQGYQRYLDAVASNAPVEAIFDAFDRFRVLCAERHGPRGVAGLNALLTDGFRRSLGPLDADPRSPWYPGRPIMLLANDYGLRLFNGDVGLVLPDAGNGLRAVFRDSAGGYRHVLLSRLPPHGTAFAMTVHKAQGNEFDQVLVVLPARASAVVGRELLYTSVTRARSACAIAAGSDTLMSGISARLSRHSGLRSRLADARKHAGGR
jgi:exodeoxyribonuclease V alpha subunit